MTSHWRVAVRTPRERAEEAPRRCSSRSRRRASRSGTSRTASSSPSTWTATRSRPCARGCPARPSNRSRTAGRTPGARSTGRSRWPGSGSARRGRRPPIPRGRSPSTQAARSAPARTPTTRLCVELLAESRAPRVAARRRLRLGRPRDRRGAASASARSPASTSIRSRSRRPPRTPPPMASSSSHGWSTRSPGPLPAADVAVANVLLRSGGGDPRPTRADVAITSGYLAGERPAHTEWRHRETVVLDGWAADCFERGRDRRGLSARPIADEGV